MKVTYLSVPEVGIGVVLLSRSYLVTGNSIFLKLENLQMTGSFKERGATNRILAMTDADRRKGVIAASAGNHGQGMAYHATQNHIPVQIGVGVSSVRPDLLG